MILPTIEGELPRIEEQQYLQQKGSYLQQSPSFSAMEGIISIQCPWTHYLSDAVIREQAKPLSTEVLALIAAVVFHHGPTHSKQLSNNGMQPDMAITVPLSPSHVVKQASTYNLLRNHLIFVRRLLRRCPRLATKFSLWECLWLVDKLCLGQHSMGRQHPN